MGIITATRPREFWEAYLSERTGTYEYRCRRYSAVLDQLRALGFRNDDIVYDVGAGMCEFGRHLYREADWSGRYVPVDGAIDGIDLNWWYPPDRAHVFVAIEVLEHLEAPWNLLQAFENMADRGAVITTPNPDAVDVLALDHTHVTPIGTEYMERRGWSVETKALFGKQNDTLIATWEAS